MNAVSEGVPSIIIPILSTVLLALGVICLITRGRVIKQVLGLSIMLQGALLIIIDAGRVQGQLQVAQSLVISALVVEVIVMAIALALIGKAVSQMPF